MWRTPEDDRILQGKEGDLVRAAIVDLANNLYDWQEPDGDYLLGIKVFDRLTYAQKLWTLKNVADALFGEDIPTPELTAYSEGAIATIFEQVIQGIALEIDAAEYDYRPMVLAALAECGIESEINRDCTVLSQWAEAVYPLSDRILWDSDYELDDIFLDISPEHSPELHDCSRISADYFSAVPADPQDIDAQSLFEGIVAYSAC